MQREWSAVDAFFAERLVPPDNGLDAVLAANAAAGLPPHDVSPLQGRFLEILVRMIGEDGTSRVEEFRDWLARNQHKSHVLAYLYGSKTPGTP